MGCIVILEVVLILLINTALDYYFYQKLTFLLYNFLEFNVFKNLSIFYGTAPWHFTFSKPSFDVDVILAINDIRLEEKYTFTYWLLYY